MLASIKNSRVHPLPLEHESSSCFQQTCIGTLLCVIQDHHLMIAEQLERLSCRMLDVWASLASR
jgi:hypothetical protein